MKYRLSNLFSLDNIPKFTARFLQSPVLMYLAIGLLTLKIITSVLYIPFPQNFFFADITKIDLLNLLNQNRQAAGVPQLTESATLDRAAYLKAQDMIQKGYFAHQSPQGTTPWFWFLKAGYNYAYAGENLAIGFINSSDVEAAWLNSPSHKANMVNPNYKEVGTAVLSGFGNDNTTVVVQLFGTKAPVAKPAAKTNVVPPAIGPKPVTAAPQQVATQDQSSVAVQLPKVLADETQNYAYTAPTESSSNSWYFKLLNFIVYSNSSIIQILAYGLLFVIGGCLIGYLIATFDQAEKRLVVKSLVLVAIILVTLTISPATFGALLPHTVKI